MKPPPLFVGYYTKGYTNLAMVLIGSLRILKLDHEVHAIRTLGSWALNTAYKPTFLMRLRDKHPRRPLVWLDADARVVGDVSYFNDLQCDVAAHYFHGDELASGTVYVGNSHEAYELLRRWAWRCGRFPDMLDQRALQIEAEAMPGLTLQRLPERFCAIDGLSTCEDAAIVHGQASRLMKGGSVCGV